MSGSLATSTGPRGGGDWSVAPHQYVHVGETVSFSFVLYDALRREPLNAAGRADYCTLDFGGPRLQAELDPDGAFYATHAFTDVPPGKNVTVAAQAWWERGVRDSMQVAGEWLQPESPKNQPDDLVAAASMRLTVYQSRVEIAVPAGGRELDWSTGRLMLRTGDGRETVIYEDRPPRSGFQVAPAASGGGWLVTYEPRIDEIEVTGVTPAELSVYDAGGQRHAWSTDLATP